MSKSRGGGWLPRLQSLPAARDTTELWHVTGLVLPVLLPSGSSLSQLLCLPTSPLPCCRTWPFYNGAFSSRISQSFFLSFFSPILLPSPPPLSEYLWCKITSLSQSGASFPLQTSSPASVSPSPWDFGPVCVHPSASVSASEKGRGEGGDVTVLSDPRSHHPKDN